LSFYDQTDPVNHTCNSEFLCGEHILTASIETAGAISKELYLPKGTWYDYWQNQSFLGGNKYEISLQKDTFPLFIAAGAVIPFYPLQQYVDEYPIEVVDLKVYFKNGHAVSHLYEDAHDGYEYEKGQFRFSTFSVSGDFTSLTIAHTWEGHHFVTYHYRLTIIGLPFQINSTYINGREVPKETLFLDANFTQFKITS
jgi:alpha-glucosidase